MVQHIPANGTTSACAKSRTGGTSYGMSEETLAFYALVTATMMAAGFDSLTAVATIALGAGSGVLGSTVNPFLVSTSIDSLKVVGIATNQAVVIGIGVALWLSSLLIDRKSTRLNSSHIQKSRMPSSA